MGRVSELRLPGSEWFIVVASMRASPKYATPMQRPPVSEEGMAVTVQGLGFWVFGFLGLGFRV